MKPHVSEWVDHPSNILECKGYVIMVDNREMISTYGPFISPEEALDFLAKIGESAYEITIQPLCKLKGTHSKFRLAEGYSHNVH